MVYAAVHFYGNLYVVATTNIWFYRRSAADQYDDQSYGCQVVRFVCVYCGCGLLFQISRCRLAYGCRLQCLIFASFVLFVFSFPSSPCCSQRTTLFRRSFFIYFLIVMPPDDIFLISTKSSLHGCMSHYTINTDIGGRLHSLAHFFLLLLAK